MEGKLIRQMSPTTWRCPSDAVIDKKGRDVFLRLSLLLSLQYLVGWQEGQPACKKLDAGLLVDLMTIWLELCTSYSSGCTTTSIVLSSSKIQNGDTLVAANRSTWKMAVKIVVVVYSSSSSSSSSTSSSSSSSSSRRRGCCCCRCCRCCCRYEMVYRQAVSSEDMFLQLGNKTPMTSSCEELVVSHRLQKLCFPFFRNGSGHFVSY